MKNDLYSILEIFEFTNLEQLIIPEIQRDYVWEKNEIFDLLESIQDGFESTNGDIPYLGFIYAYQDRDYVYKYFLTDGQQRMTTIYLILIACFQLINKDIPDYLINNGKLKLDYKVRQITHEFLIDFVNHCQNNNSQNDFNIEDQIWFHKGYENDKTIHNITTNYIAIKEWISTNFIHDKIKLFLEYVENTVKVSYFNIENVRQGEDFYIYMNSRGRNLEANETLKAYFLGELDDENNKLTWGEKWENWQDFFWKHKDKNDLDADNCFNEFLRKIQIINMCDLGMNSDDISRFVINSGNKKITKNLLPKTLIEIEKYFESYKWLVESETVKEFFKKYESEDFLTKTPVAGKQIYYLRILPVISLLSKLDFRDEDIVIRFIRFFYNIARKSNVSKDIANQLQIAIRLIYEYSETANGDYDVSDLVEYQKNRSVIINNEEIIKLGLYKEPCLTSTRKELEDLFWSAEDHYVFNGEIQFLLKNYNLKEQNDFDLSLYKSTWRIFKELFDERKSNNQYIIRALLYYGNTWEHVSPFYYNNYNCQNWQWLVTVNRGKYLQTLLKDLLGKSVDYLNIIIKTKIKEYFIKNNLDSIKKIKSVSGLVDQVKILNAIDYYSDKYLWNKYGYIAEDTNYKYGDTPFFDNDRRIFNISRYIRSGVEGRVIANLSNVLNNEEKLKEILIKIFKELPS